MIDQHHRMAALRLSGDIIDAATCAKSDQDFKRRMWTALETYRLEIVWLKQSPHPAPFTVIDGGASR